VPGAWTKLLVALWALVVIGAMGALWRYKLTPGSQAELHATWPVGSRIERAASGPTLLLFAHPRCPCTRASLAELRRVLSPFAGQVKAEIVLLQGGDGSPGWDRDEALGSAFSIPGVSVAADRDGSEARRFGAITSGHVVLYGTRGELLFSGGITPGRGHQGDSPQEERLVELLRRETQAAGALTNSPDAPLGRVGAVYGCPLRVKR